jgi:hypothetical protein
MIFFPVVKIFNLSFHLKEIPLGNWYHFCASWVHILLDHLGSHFPVVLSQIKHWTLHHYAYDFVYFRWLHFLAYFNFGFGDFTLFSFKYITLTLIYTTQVRLANGVWSAVEFGNFWCPIAPNAVCAELSVFFDKDFIYC